MKFCRLKHIVLHEIPYWIKCRLWYRYNVLKIKTLPPTWCDRDHLICHAMFQILDDFITKEKIDDIIDWDSDLEHRQARDKMTEIINWWKNIFLKFDAWEGIKVDFINNDEMFIKDPNRPGLYEMKPFSDSDRTKLDLVNERERAIEEELEKKLRELLDIRKYLWT